jgi:hypothetical protein
MPSYVLPSTNLGPRLPLGSLDISRKQTLALSHIDSSMSELDDSDDASSADFSGSPDEPLLALKPKLTTYTSSQKATILSALLSFGGNKAATTPVVLCTRAAHTDIHPYPSSARRHLRVSEKVRFGMCGVSLQSLARSA